MQSIRLWFTKKKSRFTALSKTTFYTWRFQGSSALANQMFRFFKGERQNSRLLLLDSMIVPNNGEKSNDYQKWIRRNQLDSSALAWQTRNAEKFEYRPLISVLTRVYAMEETTLKKMIRSVFRQTYANWELCLAVSPAAKNVKNLLEKYEKEDSRIKLKFLDAAADVSDISNEAVKMSAGEFTVLLDYRDELSPAALYEIVSLLNRHSDADMIYSDEDQINDEGARGEPHFKPDWSPDLFCSTMYTAHLGVYRTETINQIGGFRSDFEGAQDWDLVLRLTEQTDKIYHIPKILYHRRMRKDSADSNPNRKNQIKAVSEHFRRLEIEAEIAPGLADNLLRARRKISTSPKISIIIPTRDQPKMLQNCIDSIRRHSTYRNYEITIVNNNSRDPATFEYFEEIRQDSDIRLIDCRCQFNFAAINNSAATHAGGDLLLFLNNDTEVISPEWLEAMTEHAVRPEVGAVGARLLYSDGTIQHAGVIVGIGGIAGHAHKYFSKDDSGYFSRAKAVQNLSAVTAACMMVRAETFKSLGGFNEKLPVAYNDVDFCLRIRRENLLIVYTPYAELYHHESVSRGSDKTRRKSVRLQEEAQYMRAFWKDELKYDPYYNPNLTMEKEDFSISAAGFVGNNLGE